MPAENNDINIAEDTAEETRILYESRSIEVDDILNTKPPWLTRWGITIVAILILSLFFVANFISYPDYINAKVAVTYINNTIVVTGETEAQNYTLVKQGQPVLITLDAYSSSQYGTIRGVIVSDAVITTSGSYKFNIRLNEGLITTNGQRIPKNEEFNGTGEILVEQKTMLQAILSNFKF